jgi:hypothetical protein
MPQANDARPSFAWERLGFEGWGETQAKQLDYCNRPAVPTIAGMREVTRPMGEDDGDSL